jgi:hypothetical protein
MAAIHSGGLELTWTNKHKALLSTGDGRYDYTFVDRRDPHDSPMLHSPRCFESFVPWPMNADGPPMNDDRRRTQRRGPRWTGSLAGCEKAFVPTSRLVKCDWSWTGPRSGAGSLRR